MTVAQHINYKVVQMCLSCFCGVIIINKTKLCFAILDGKEVLHRNNLYQANYGGRFWLCFMVRWMRQAMVRDSGEIEAHIAHRTSHKST
jgi:hypothetical protein